MIGNTKPVSITDKVMLETTKRTLDIKEYRKVSQTERILELPPEENQTRYSREELEKAIRDTNRVLFNKNDRFEFKVHERTGRMMVKLVDCDTKEVIKEIPPEKILDLVASIWDLVGILVDERG